MRGHRGSLATPPSEGAVARACEGNGRGRGRTVRPASRVRQPPLGEWGHVGILGTVSYHTNFIPTGNESTVKELKQFEACFLERV